jgi:hypothetical protein
MWIPSHVGLVGNELVDDRAQQAALEGTIFDRPLSLSDFQSLARPELMRAWQAKWDSTDTGRPLFEGQKEERRFVWTVSMVLSGHCSVRSHLGRFRIVVCR